MQTDINSWNFDFTGELFSEHFLKDRLPECKEYLESENKSQKLFDEIRDLYINKKDILKTCEESTLEEYFIKPILKKLEHDWDVQPPVLSEKGIEYRPDYALFGNESSRDEAIKNREKDSDRYFDLSVGLVEAKKWDEELDKGKKRNPAVQIKKYLRITQINWGILTNGKKWRLYCKESGFSSNVYLEFDLEEILVNKDLRSFQYFYTILNQKSFLKRKEKSFLDRIYDKNIRFARAVEDDLEENVYEALKILSEGFLNFHKNDLDENDIETIHDNCLILLYRLLFLFYAESKKLIRFENGKKRYSLLNFTKDIIEEETVSSQDNYSWNILKKSFDIVNKGSWEIIREKGIPPYNGGLFDPDKHGFLEKYSIGDSYLKEALNLLARRKSGEWVDYETLQIRHLGSIYEKLLEYKLKVANTDLSVDKDGGYKEVENSDSIAVEKGEVYLVTDKGERKATGSYYTPDYVVQYIVENTVGKLIEEKTKEARGKGESEAKSILQLKVLDPAMGSGHFLVATTDYMAEELLEAIHRDVENNLWDKNEKDQAWAKREIVSHCIYGVDLNPLAVELAKLSLWLTTFAEGHPLNFLDHRLKCGNSLIGTEIDKLPYFPGEKKKGNLYTPYIEVLTKQVSELLEVEEETVNDVKKKERLFKKIKDSKAYKRVKTLADARTATFFDVDIGGKDPKSRYMNLVNEAYYGNESKWKRRNSQSWVKKGRRIAEEKNFFHWELEFPEVFFEKGDFKEKPGFDAVIGNPPYVNIENIPELDRKYQLLTYNLLKGRFDLYVAFMERAMKLLGHNNIFSFIVPYPFVYERYGTKVRKKLSEDYSVEKLLDLSKSKVFEDATVRNLVFIIRKKNPEINEVKIQETEDTNGVKFLDSKTTYQSSFKNNPNISFRLNLTKDKIEIINKLEENKYRYGDIFYINWGARTGNIDKYVVKDNSHPEARKMINGRNIDRYNIRYSGEYLIYEKDSLYNPMFEELFENPKFFVPDISGNIGIRAAFDNENYYAEHTVNIGVRKDRIRNVKRNNKNIVDQDINFDKIEKVDEKFAVTLLNSKLINFYFLERISGGLHVYPNDLKQLPLKIADKDTKNILNENYDGISEKNEILDNINLKIKDYLGTYSDGKAIKDLYDPVKGLSNTILTDTSKDRKNLRISRVDFVKKAADLVMKISVRYKPENGGEHETDRWGYIETEMIPAMRFSDSEKMLALIEEFTKIAVEKGKGFAGFRKTATKTKSVIDRLEELTLPKLDDAEIGLNKFLENKKRAEKLEEEIIEIDNMIDAIVFNLYGLTKNEVEVVLDSLKTSMKEKLDILKKFE
ncbi:MAG: TaqI-like C-terminal specificity domain-containing protein [Candidatus Thermoplasmatota archaeon]